MAAKNVSMLTCKLITGSTNAAAFLKQVAYWDEKTGGKAFYKFKEPPTTDNKLYKLGDSWMEELGMTVPALDGVIKLVGTKIKKGVSKTEAYQGTGTNNLVLYWIDRNRITYYTLNRPLLKAYETIIANIQEVSGIMCNRHLSQNSVKLIAQCYKINCKVSSPGNIFEVSTDNKSINALIEAVKPMRVNVPTEETEETVTGEVSGSDIADNHVMETALRLYREEIGPTSELVITNIEYMIDSLPEGHQIEWFKHAILQAVSVATPTHRPGWHYLETLLKSWVLAGKVLTHKEAIAQKKAIERKERKEAEETEAKRVSLLPKDQQPKRWYSDSELEGLIDHFGGSQEGQRTFDDLEF